MLYLSLSFIYYMRINDIPQTIKINNYIDYDDDNKENTGIIVYKRHNINNNCKNKMNNYENKLVYNRTTTKKMDKLIHDLQ